MPIETLTYVALAAGLKFSPVAARSVVEWRRLPRSPSGSGKAMVNVDLAEIRHTPRKVLGGLVAELAAQSTATDEPLPG